jgi:hypothetical protein
MQCPECGRKYGFWSTWRIFNPFRHRCLECRAVLTMGGYGVLTIVAGSLLGAALVGVAITMEETGRWSFTDSLVWFAGSLLVTAPIVSFLIWRVAKFRTKAKA